jgi:hypothetical protein
MGEIVNLRRARKAKTRADAEALAAENRARHGTSKPARDLTKARSGQDSRSLDAHKLAPDKPLKD